VGEGFLAEYRTIAGVAGPLVVVELVKVFPLFMNRSIFLVMSAARGFHSSVVASEMLL
jgi:hypothetical protein